MKKRTLASLTIGSAMTFAAGTIEAGVNPFSAESLDRGYQLAAHHEHGDDKDGADKDAQGSCGGMKGEEGKCGEGACGGKDEEGKCGEGGCGDGQGTAKDSEGKCGEGQCGG